MNVWKVWRQTKMEEGPGVIWKYCIGLWKSYILNTSMKQWFGCCPLHCGHSYAYQPEDALLGPSTSSKLQQSISTSHPPWAWNTFVTSDNWAWDDTSTTGCSNQWCQSTRRSNQWYQFLETNIVFNMMIAIVEWCTFNRMHHHAPNICMNNPMVPSCKAVLSHNCIIIPQKPWNTAIIATTPFPFPQ